MRYSPIPDSIKNISLPQSPSRTIQSLGLRVRVGVVRVRVRVGVRVRVRVRVKASGRVRVRIRIRVRVRVRVRVIGFSSLSFSCVDLKPNRSPIPNS